MVLTDISELPQGRVVVSTHGRDFSLFDALSERVVVYG